jgi:hypothetical protein
MEEQPVSNSTTVETLVELFGKPAPEIAKSKLPNLDLVIWCHEHPWEAAWEIERLRASLKMAGEGDGAAW